MSLCKYCETMSMTELTPLLTPERHLCWYGQCPPPPAYEIRYVKNELETKRPVGAGWGGGRTAARGGGGGVG
jgi:hypothetical protein